MKKKAQQNQQKKKNKPNKTNKKQSNKYPPPHKLSVITLAYVSFRTGKIKLIKTNFLKLNHFYFFLIISKHVLNESENA